MAFARVRVCLASCFVLATLGIIALMLSSAAQPLPPAGIHFVDDSATTGLNDGTSWLDAFTTLDNAISTAAAGDYLFVAEGTYAPATSSGDGFVVTKHLFIYGGFDGTEATLDTRAGLFEATVLDGTSATRVVTVSGVTGTPGVVIDGFQIKDGVGSGGTYGAGFNGAGIYSTGSDLDLGNCLFNHNLSGHDGGGLYYTGPSGTPNTLNIKLCEFRENRAEDKGGAMFGSFLTDGDVVNTLFNQNHTISSDGGAVYLEDMGSANQLWFTNCIFWKNYVTATGTKGGAVSLGESSASTTAAANAMIVNCTFVGNQALTCTAGQALSISTNSSCEIYNSIVWFNNDITCSGVLPIAGPITAIDYSDVQFSTGHGFPSNVIDITFRPSG